MKTQVIIPAAGLGMRMKVRGPKPLLLLQGQPLVVYALETFQKHSLIHSIILAVPKNAVADFDRCVRKYRLSKVKKIISGGATRRDSVHNGLKALDSNTEVVLIHDGARPFVSMKLIEGCLCEIYKEKSVITALPVKATIKRVNTSEMTVKETLDRKTLWKVQTPQVFRKYILERAHRDVQLFDPTDDSQLVEKCGIRTKIIPGEEKNIKITTREDLYLAEALLCLANGETVKKMVGTKNSRMKSRKRKR